MPDRPFASATRRPMEKLRAQECNQFSRLIGIHNETHADLARILSFAATYMEERGRARFKFGRRGEPMCPAAAIGAALGFSPRQIGWSRFFRIRTVAVAAVGTVILRSRLLDRLPVPASRNGRRRSRPVQMSPYHAVRELARWNDDKALDTLVIGAFRNQAARLREARQPVSAPAR
jgi:hypothetical protein